MTVTAAALRDGVRTWARSQDQTVAALRRALQVVYGQRGRPRSLDDIVEAMLLSVARRHEAAVGLSLGSIDQVLLRLLDDVDAVRTAAAQGRSPAMRAADLHVLADAMAELVRFEDRVRLLVDTEADPLRNTLRTLLGGGDEALPAAVPAVRRTLEQGERVLAWADDVRAARAAGVTLEPRGISPVAIPDPAHPTLQAGMDAMDAAVDAYRRAVAGPGITPEAAAAAFADLRQAVSDASELLRSFGRRFEVESSAGDVVPPFRRGAPAPAPGTPRADAASRAAGVLARVAAAGTSLRTAPAADLFDALRFSDLEVSASGTLGEPLSRSLPGSGVERYALTPGDVGRLATDPPWLGRRLRDLLTPAPRRGWQRAHLVGPGFGGELFAGLMLAPWGVNQLAQNRAVERWLRAAAGRLQEVPVRAVATGRRLAIPLRNGTFDYVDVLGRVRYELTGAGGRRFTVDIVVNPDGSWRVAHDLPADAAALIPRHLLAGTR